MPQTLSSAEESRLLDCLRRMVDLVDDKQLSPNEALGKLARDEQLPPGWIRLAAAAFNTGRQNAQRESVQDVREKLAAFALADAAEVIRGIYPKEPETPERRGTKQGISADYERPPDWYRPLKKSAAERAPSLFEKRASFAASATTASDPWSFSRYKNAQQSLGRLKSLASQARERAATALEKLAQYFCRDVRGRLPFAALKQLVGVRHKTAAAQRLLKLAEHKLGKQATSAPYGPNPYPEVLKPGTPRGLFKIKGVKELDDPKHAPFPTKPKIKVRPGKPPDDLPPGAPPPPPDKEELLPPPFEKKSKSQGSQAYFGPIPDNWEAYQAFQDCLHWSGAHKQAQAAYERTLSWTPASATALLQARRIKQAGPISPYTALMSANAIHNLLRFEELPELPEKKEEKVNESPEYLALADPSQEAEIRKYRAQALLSELMSNDDVISGYSPDDVLSAYNEMVEAAPRIATTAAYVRPELRRRLAGNPQPFEATELANLEKTLAQTRETGQSILKNKSPSPLGKR